MKNRLLTLIIKTIILSVFILLITLLLGCWDYREYEKMAIISAMGFDSGPGDGEVTVTIAIAPAVSGQSPGGGGGGSSAPVAQAVPRENVYSAHARTVTAALDKISEVMGNERFFGYVRVMVLGDNLTADTLKKIMLYLDMSLLFRSSMNLVVANGTARDIINTYDPEASDISSRNIITLLDATKQSGVAFPVKLFDFYRKFFAEGVEPAVPVIAIEKIPEQSEQTNTAATVTRDTFGKLRPIQAHYRVSGMAAFKRSKVAGFLNGRESRGLGLILNQQYFSHLTAKAPAPGENHTVPTLFRIARSKTRIKVALNQHHPEIFLDTKIQAYIEGVLEEGVRLDAKQLKQFQKSLARAVKGDMAAAARQARELGADIFGFGRQFQIQHQREWKNEYKEQWDACFRNAPVHIRVSAIILNTGKVVETLREQP
jgi:spore germination protein KC